MFQVTNYDNTYMRITDLEDNEVIYNGPRDVDCVIEALAFYFGVDEVEHNEDELEQYNNEPKVTQPIDIKVDGSNPLKSQEGDYPNDD